MHKNIYVSIISFFLLIAIFSGVMIYSHFKEANEQEELYESLAQIVEKSETSPETEAPMPTTPPDGDELVIAIEFKSQVGPSFGNNFNNRTEEAMGTALDIWTAYREGVFGNQKAPWLGYFMVLEDCYKSNEPVRVRSPHFDVLEEFIDASYKERYEIFCNKLLLERQYSAACFTTTSFSEEEITYNFPREHLSFEAFAVSMLSAALSHFIRR